MRARNFFRKILANLRSKGTGALMFSGEGNLVHYCFQDKEGSLLYLGSVHI